MLESADSGERKTFLICDLRQIMEARTNGNNNLTILILNCVDVG